MISSATRSLVALYKQMLTQLSQSEFILFFPGGVSIRPGAECGVHPLLAVFCHRYWCVAAQMRRHVVLIDGLSCPLSSTAVRLGKKRVLACHFLQENWLKNGGGLSTSTKKIAYNKLFCGSLAQQSGLYIKRTSLFLSYRLANTNESVF